MAMRRVSFDCQSSSFVRAANERCTRRAAYGLPVLRMRFCLTRPHSFARDRHQSSLPTAVLMHRPTHALFLVLAMVAAVAAVAHPVPLGAQTAVVSEITRLKELWIAAQLQKDSATFGRLLSDDFLFAGPDGSLLTKAQVMNAVAADQSRRPSEVGSEYRVQVHGNVAVMHGVVTITFKTDSGTREARLRFTDTWVKQAGARWQCIAAQGTRIEQ
jgi:ketosteroid isomerase-like protein